MQASESDPTTIGPWHVESVNYRSPGRVSYRATTSGLEADLLLINVPPHALSLLDNALKMSKRVLTHEFPRVLDYSLNRSVTWIASDRTDGNRLGPVIGEEQALSLPLWAELAKTALIGASALRSVGIDTFQMTPDTFIVTGDGDVVLADFWSAELQPGPFNAPDASRLNRLSSADDVFTIGKILIAAMGIDPAAKPELAVISERGYTQAHLDFVASLTSPNPQDRPSTQRALETIPGADPSWTVPVFALERPGVARAKRKAQKMILLAGVGAVVLGVLAGGALLLKDRFGSDARADGPADKQVSASAEPADNTYTLRLTLAKGDETPEIFTNVDDYTFGVCSTNTKLLTPSVAKRIEFQTLLNDEWITLKDVRAVTAQEPGMCRDKEVRVSVTLPAPDPRGAPGQWSKCTDFRLLIPEGKKNRTPVRYCLQTRSGAVPQDASNNEGSTTDGSM